MATAKRNLFDVADLLDDETLSTKRARYAGMASINPLNQKPFSSKYYKMLDQRRRLPVWSMKEEFLHDLSRNQVLVLRGETAGSGKSTQIPQFLLQAHGLLGRPKIVCTEPWSVATISVARRVAEELDVTIGEEVGYSIQFEDCCTDRTRIKFSTDEMLVREALSNPLLSDYNVIVVDEAQERTLYTDLILIILKDILQKRVDLKLVLLSSRDEATAFLKHFHQCGIPRLMVVPEIPAFPVEILYSLEDPEDSLAAAVAKDVEVHMTEPAGGLLMFLPREMIQQACADIDHALRLRSEEGLCGPFMVMPLHSELPLEMHDQVFQPAPNIWGVGIPPVRKIIVSTHIAECSLVMDGITYVIDSGTFGQKLYDPIANFETVIISEVNKKRAIQRTACAGRTRPGRCFRLYTQATFMQLPAQMYPEMVRSDLASTVLTLMKLGMTNLVGLDYLDSPAPEAVMRALDVLYQLGALDAEGNITLFGELVSELPLHPQLATAILRSQEFHCANEIISISSMLSVPTCFLRPTAAQQATDEAHARFRHADGDHFTMLNVYNMYKQNNHDPQWCADNFINMRVMRRADKIREKLLAIMTRLGCRTESPDISNGSFTNNIKLALLSGFFMHVAHLEQDGNYCTIKYNQVVRVDPELDNGAQTEWVVFNEYALRNSVVIRTVTGITAEMLIQVARHFCDLRQFPECEAKRALRTLFIDYLIRRDRRLFGFLNHRPYHEVNDALGTLQWLVPIRAEVAPPA